MIRPGFLSEAERKELRALARDGRSEARVSRRANALVLLNDGWSCSEVATALLMDDDTVRSWHKLYEEQGLTGLVVFHQGGSEGHLTFQQEAELVKWIRATLPRSTQVIGAWINKTYGIDYSRAGLIALLHRLDIDYCKPKVVPSKLNPAKQQAFIETYEDLLNNLADDEAVMFADAVHPTHEARPAGCWAPKDTKVALEQTSGRQRLNIHGAIDLETGNTRMIEVLTVDALSTIALLMAIVSMFPNKRLIHVFLDNARYHHAQLVQEWLAKPGCRIKLHFIPSYCPHLDPIERLWGLMHKNVTHNHCYATYNDFCSAVLHFLRKEVPKNWAKFCDSVTDNFRVIDPADFRVLRAS
jgi:transposase